MYIYGLNKEKEEAVIIHKVLPWSEFPSCTPGGHAHCWQTYVSRHISPHCLFSPERQEQIHLWEEHTEKLIWVTAKSVRNSGCCCHLSWHWCTISQSSKWPGLDSILMLLNLDPESESRINSNYLPKKLQEFLKTKPSTFFLIREARKCIVFNACKHK